LPETSAPQLTGGAINAGWSVVAIGATENFDLIRPVTFFESGHSIIVRGMRFATQPHSRRTVRKPPFSERHYGEAEKCGGIV
jgi:hypothetical protein